MVTFMQPCLVEESCLVTSTCEYWKCDPVGGFIMMSANWVTPCTDTCRGCCTFNCVRSLFTLENETSCNSAHSTEVMLRSVHHDQHRPKHS